MAAKEEKIGVEGSHTEGAAFVDIFDEIVMSENTFQREGFEKGKQIGKESGYIDGYNLGKEQGTRIGTEIGFYKGFVSVWLKLLEEGTVNKPRVLKVAKTLHEKLEKFDLTNPQLPTLQDDVLQIRAKFKHFTSLLHITQENVGTQGTKNEGTSF